jgi:RNA polymerase sigma factor (sigma-70 family)
MSLSIDEKLEHLLKYAKLQGFVGISQIEEIADNVEDDENILRQKLTDAGVEINVFLRTPTPKFGYRTAVYHDKKRTSFSLTTRIDEKGNTSILTPQKEKELFQKMTYARNEILKYNSENTEISESAQAKRNSMKEEYSTYKREIIEANIRLVFSIAKEYSAAHKGILDISDIIQEGNIGLIDAVESFDCERGIKFSSWAVWYIRRQIWTAVNSFKKGVYVPAKTSTQLHKISIFEERYKAQKGENPSVYEIAEELGLKEKHIMALLAYDFGELSQSNEFAGICFNDLEKADEQTNDPFNILAQRVLKENIDKMLCEIPERERQMLILYFGLSPDKEPMNMAQIGTMFEISRERVRQIIDNSLEQMKKRQNTLIKEYR